MDKPHIFSFALPSHEISEELSEQVGHDNPLAVEVAKPLFDAGVQFAALTERPEFLRAEPWTRPWHTFYLVIQGELRMTTGGRSHTWQAGDLAFCPAGAPFVRSGLPGQPVRWIYIRLHDTPTWERLKQHGFTSRRYESADLLFLLLRRILDAHRYRSTELIALAHSHARGIVDLLRHELSLIGSPPQPYAAPLQKLMAEIQQDPGADWSSKLLAERLNVSTRKLYRIFSAEYGMPPKEMVIKQRIAQAAEQLARTTIPIGKIAEALGYQSLYSFSNLFKKHTGIRPSDHRKKFRR